MTTENNILIAEFMGAIYMSHINAWFIMDEECSSEELKYNSSWNWLMPVVEKIEQTTIKMKIDRNEGCSEFEPDYKEEEWQFSVEITNSQCMIHQDVLPQYYGTNTDFLKTYNCRNEGNVTKLEATYNAVIEFIKWYNENSAEKN